MKPGSKYYPLYQRLSQAEDETVTLTLEEIETCLSSPLPASARSRASWWSNRSKGGYQASAWINAGYQTTAIDLEKGAITFNTFRAEYQVQRVNGQIRWDKAAIRALRQHMQLTQLQFAEAMGVRRQTVSEWENGVYLPDRSTTKHLELLAERQSFESPEELS